MLDSYEGSKDNSSVESRDDPVPSVKVGVTGDILALTDETALVTGLATIGLGEEAIAAVELQLGNGVSLSTGVVDSTISRVRRVGKTLALETCTASRQLDGVENPSDSTQDVLIIFRIINDSVF